MNQNLMNFEIVKKTRSSRPMAAKRDSKNKSLDFFLLEYSKKYYFHKGQGEDKVEPKDPHPCPMCMVPKMTLLMSMFPQTIKYKTKTWGKANHRG